MNQARVGIRLAGYSRRFGDTKKNKVMNPQIHEKLVNLSNYSHSAVMILSKLRRTVAAKGYEFDLTQKGCPILLIEAARILDCETSRQLARNLLSEMGISSNELQFH